MSMYMNSLKIDSNDAICAATTLGNTVVGILFEKKGAEIKEALQARLNNIDKKIIEYTGILDKTEQFLTEKKAIIKELDEYYRERSESKLIILKPNQDELDDLLKKYRDQKEKIDKKMKIVITSFDKQTQKEVGSKAVRFEDSFDSFKKQFFDIEEILKADKTLGITGTTASSYVNNGFYTTAAANCSNNNAVYTSSTGDVGFGVNTPTSELVLRSQPSKEDQALIRLSSLKTLLKSYEDKITAIKEKMSGLDLERRKLNLIYRNIDVERDYKLDLNKLSAFGFEDIDIK